MTSPRRIAVTGVVVTLALIAASACSGGDSTGNAAASTTTAPPPATTTAPPPTYEPVFTAGPCVDEVQVTNGVDCGILTVPEDRTDPGGAQVRLPVAIIRTTAPKADPDPIIYFSGGPGFPGLTSVDFFVHQDFGGSRDVILFDQRGTGEADPSLDCTENVEAVWATLAAADDGATEATRQLDVLDTCKARLVAAGINPDAYNTDATADDVDDLRKALGIAEWNIFGVSYGTTVALDVLRRHPDAVRSAVIDSVYPTTVGFGGVKALASAARVFTTFFAGCLADPGCAAAYPTLQADVLSLVDEWNAEPFQGDVTDPTTQQPRHLVITGTDVIAGMWNALYDHSLIGILPSLVEPLRERGSAAQAIVEQLASMGIDQLSGAAEGQTIAVDCGDRQRIDTLTGADTMLAEHPELAGLLELSPTRQACARWRVTSEPASFNDPVASDVPTLVLADEYDPVTPPADGKSAADALTDSTFVQFPGLGHGAIFSADCPAAIFKAFVLDPTAAVDTSCVATMGPPDWTLPAG